MSRVQQSATLNTAQKQAASLTVSEYRPYNQHANSDPYKLEFIFFNDLVKYKCSCGHMRNLETTYFCRHCMVLRCRGCVSHEVDSQYCQHCLEYIPTIDPKFQMNKCASCYQCPSCHHLLTTSVLTISSPSEPSLQKESLKRTCQLVCEFCRWSSESFITDSSRALNNIGDIEIDNAARIRELISFYKALCEKERSDKKKRRYHSRSGNTMDLLKKYGIDNTLSPKLFESLRARTNFRNKYNPTAKHQPDIKSSDEIAIDGFKPSESLEEVIDEFDSEYYYSKDFSVESMAGITQRLSQVELQPEKVSKFRPVSKSLSVKRSVRCKECERNLCRSEYSPVSTRFKIQSAAYYHVPELKLRSHRYPMQLETHMTNIVEFTLQNQTLGSVKVKLDHTEDYDKDLCDLILPKYELSLGPKDETVEYEHVPLGLRPLNDETQIIFQSHSKIGFFIKVVPNMQAEDLSISFTMSHDVFLPQNSRENDKNERITHTVQVQLGSAR